MRRFRWMAPFCVGAAVFGVASCSGDDGAPAAAAGSSGALADAPNSSDTGAAAGSGGAAGAQAAGGASPEDGSAGTAGAAGIGSTAGGSSVPGIRGSTSMPCVEPTDCPSGVCIGNFCDDPGCGPTPGITEVCDGKDNDCDAIADNPGTCDVSCRGSIVDGRTYMFCSPIKTFYEAEASCRSKGMHLFRVDSATEQQQVGTEAGRLQSSAVGWIGALEHGNDEVWRWLGGDVFWRGGPNGAPEAGRFSAWGTGQPNDGGQDHLQRCVRTAGSWNDWGCGTRLSYICELYNFAAGCFDLVKNGTETGVDCGGSCGPCATGEACSGNADCQSESCVAGTCVDTCRDGLQNASESAIDCGGYCRRCPTGRTCGDESDCGSRLCTGGTCAACVTTTCPACDDGYKCCSIEGHCGCKGLTTQICLGGATP